MSLGPPLRAIIFFVLGCYSEGGIHPWPCKNSEVRYLPNVLLALTCQKLAGLLVQSNFALLIEP